MAAQQRIRELREVVAIQALLDLPNSATGNNNQGGAPAGVNALLSPDTSDSDVKLDIAAPLSDANPVDHEDTPTATEETDDSTNCKSTTYSDNILLSPLKQDVDEDNLTLAEIKEQEEENLPFLHLRID